MPSNCKLT